MPNAAQCGIISLSVKVRRFCGKGAAMEQQEQQLMKLEGTVEHVIYENADSGYAVFEVDAGGTDMVVAGNVGGVDNAMSGLWPSMLVMTPQVSQSKPYLARS